MIPQEFAGLSDAKATALVQLVNDRQRRQFRYAMAGILCGSACFLACIGAYVYLVRQGDSTEAYIVLGTAVLGIVGSMIKSRL